MKRHLLVISVAIGFVSTAVVATVQISSAADAIAPPRDASLAAKDVALMLGNQLHVPDSSWDSSSAIVHQDFGLIVATISRFPWQSPSPGTDFRWCAAGWPFLAWGTEQQDIRAGTGSIDFRVADPTQPYPWRRGFEFVWTDSRGSPRSLRVPTVPLWPGLLANTVLSGVLAYPIVALTVALWATSLRAWRRRRGLCPLCGYRHVDSGSTCPECGVRAPGSSLDHTG